MTNTETEKGQIVEAIMRLQKYRDRNVQTLAELESDRALLDGLLHHGWRNQSPSEDVELELREVVKRIDRLAGINGEIDYTLTDLKAVHRGETYTSVDPGSFLSGSST